MNGKGITIRTGDHCLYKEAIYGCMHCAEEKYNMLKEKYSGFVVTYYDDTDPEFVSTQVDMPGMIEEI